MGRTAKSRGQCRSSPTGICSGTGLGSNFNSPLRTAVWVPRSCPASHLNPNLDPHLCIIYSYYYYDTMSMRKNSVAECIIGRKNLVEVCLNIHLKSYGKRGSLKFQQTSCDIWLSGSIIKPMRKRFVFVRLLNWGIHLTFVLIITLTLLNSAWSDSEKVRRFLYAILCFTTSRRTGGLLCCGYSAII